MWVQHPPPPPRPGLFQLRQVHIGSRDGIPFGAHQARRGWASETQARPALILESGLRTGGGAGGRARRGPHPSGPRGLPLTRPVTRDSGLVSGCESLCKGGRGSLRARAQGQACRGRGEPAREQGSLGAWAPCGDSQDLSPSRHHRQPYLSNFGFILLFGGLKGLVMVPGTVVVHQLPPALGDA